MENIKPLPDFGLRHYAFGENPVDESVMGGRMPYGVFNKADIAAMYPLPD